VVVERLLVLALKTALARPLLGMSAVEMAGHAETRAPETAEVVGVQEDTLEMVVTAVLAQALMDKMVQQIAVRQVVAVQVVIAT
jgi:hypothetical protein